MDMPPTLPAPRLHARTATWTPGAAPCAVAVGNFDGVHVGHAAIVARLLSEARSRGLPAVALSFDPHPAAVLRPDRVPAPLTTIERRAALLLDLGVDAVVVQPADRLLMGLAPDAFYRGFLRGRLQAEAFVEGSDFRFGADRAGDVTLLGRLAAADGLSCAVVPPVLAGGTPVSSSRLRGLVAAGDVAAARRLLTADYRVSGTVVVGARRGTGLGFPTANLADIATLVPAGGVYAARVTVPGGRKPVPAAVHVGPNVTFGEQRTSVEAHLIGFSGSLYGARLDVDFLERLRDTRQFPSPDELVTQLSADVAAAERVIAAACVPSA